MARNGSRLTPVYDASADLEYVEREIVTILYILGMGDDPALITIDEVIAKTKEVFTWRSKDAPPSASSDFMKEINVLLITNFRRLWHRYQLARNLSNG